MAQWAFITQNRSSTADADLSPYLADRNVSLGLNRTGVVRGKLNLGAPRHVFNFLQAGVHELRVLRDNTAVGGVYRLADVGVSLTRIGAVLDLTWVGIETYLSDLTVNAGVVTAAQSAHAWTLITNALAKTGASGYAITRGLIPATDPSKTRTYVADELDALSGIEELSERDDGFDFAFNANREFDCYYPYRGSTRDLVFEWGGNVLEMGYTVSAGPGMIGTDVTVAGSAGSVVATSTDAAAQLLYGRRDMVVKMPDVTDALGVVQTYADAIKDTSKQPVFVPSLVLANSVDHPEIVFGAYGIGDFINVRAKYGDGAFVNVSQQNRIVGIDIALDSLNGEQVTLELADDLPMKMNRAVLLRKRDLAVNATTGVATPSLAERLAAIERYIA